MQRFKLQIRQTVMIKIEISFNRRWVQTKVTSQKQCLFARIVAQEKAKRIIKQDLKGCEQVS